MNETGLAGDISCGRTKGVENDPRLFDVELSCPDDALTIGSLSSATFMMDWAFLHADAPAPMFRAPLLPCGAWCSRCAARGPRRTRARSPRLQMSLLMRFPLRM